MKHAHPRRIERSGRRATEITLHDVQRIASVRRAGGSKTKEWRDGLRHQRSPLGTRAKPGHGERRLRTALVSGRFIAAYGHLRPVCTDVAKLRAALPVQKARRLIGFKIIRHDDNHRDHIEGRVGLVEVLDCTRQLPGGARAIVLEIAAIDDLVVPPLRHA